MNMLGLLVSCVVLLVGLGVLLGSAWTLLVVSAWTRLVVQSRRRRRAEERRR